MRTTQNRKRYDRSQLRYRAILADDEWVQVAPLIPPAKSGENASMHCASECGEYRRFAYLNTIPSIS